LKTKKSKLTKFQWQVLKEAAKIPLGQTRSYKWIAKKIGLPKSARAVGQALKINPYPLIIPCHRVIKENGALGGYMGKNTTRKEKLLNLEKEIQNNFRKI